MTFKMIHFSRSFKTIARHEVFFSFFVVIEVSLKLKTVFLFDFQLQLKICLFEGEKI